MNFLKLQVFIIVDLLIGCGLEHSKWISLNCRCDVIVVCDKLRVCGLEHSILVDFSNVVDRAM